MPRLSRPVYRPERDQWYVRHEGRRVTLDVQGKHNRQAAEVAFRERLAGRRPAAQEGPAQVTARPPEVTEGRGGQGTPSPTFGSLCESFLEAKARTVAPLTAESYRWRAGQLAPAVGKDRPAADLTPAELERAVCRPAWSAPYRGDLINLARMVTRWAVANRLIDRDPLAGLKRPAGSGRRADLDLTADDYAKLLGHCDPALRAVVSFLYATGARPGEARVVTAADVDLARGLVVLKAHKTAGRTGEARVIAVPAGPGLEALADACRARPTGPVFLRASGRPWTRNTLAVAFKKARDRAGLPETLTPYTLRHIFSTAALSQGIADATVAALLGHRSTTMLHRHYSGLLSRVNILVDAVKKVRADKPAA